MKRLHLGDIVQVIQDYDYYLDNGVFCCKLKKVKNGQIGIITNISKFNNDSKDKCKYSISWESLELEEQAKQRQDPLSTSACILDGRAWFNRQQLKLLKKGYYTR